MIRNAETTDIEQVRELYVDAYPIGKGEVVGKLAVDLINDKSKPNTINLVKEEEGKIISHVSFSRVFCEDGKDLRVYCLSPLAVRKELHKRGHGTRIVQQGFEKLKQRGADFVLVYGDPQYYSRFGFDPKLGEKFVPHFELKYPFGWHGVSMSDEQLTGPTKCQFVPALNHQQYW
jgi:putative acetyltransferase